MGIWKWKLAYMQQRSAICRPFVTFLPHAAPSQNAAVSRCTHIHAYMQSHAWFARQSCEWSLLSDPQQIAAMPRWLPHYGPDVDHEATRSPRATDQGYLRVRGLQLSSNILPSVVVVFVISALWNIAQLTNHRNFIPQWHIVFVVIWCVFKGDLGWLTGVFILVHRSYGT